MASAQEIDNLFADYLQHLSSFGSGGKAYASPQTTTVPLSTKQGGVLGSCKTSSSSQQLNYLSTCTSPSNCNTPGS